MAESAGYLRCPSCLTHVRREEALCPFCGEAMSGAAEAGSGVLHRFKASRVGLVALGLAGGLAFGGVACGGEDEKKDEPPVESGNDYGGFDPEEDYDTEDAGNDAGTEADAGAPDSGTTD